MISDLARLVSSGLPAKKNQKKSSFESSQSCPKRAVISECPGQPSPPNFQKAVCLKFGINLSDHIGSSESTV